jgi:tetratricopeptide (TPR) repeat protein
MSNVVCLDEEQLLACVDGTITEGDRLAAVAHCDQCARCHELLVECVRALVPDADAPPRRAGDRVGRYLIERRIGAGGMGEVFAAVDPQLGRRVAIKVLRADLPTELGRGQRARLMSEAQALARLAHPNVVNVFEVGVIAEHVFIAMELVEGGTLTRWLAPDRPFSEVLAALVSAGRGLAAVHAAGMVHRDFKPDNVLVGQDGRVRVSDFGLARAASSPDESGEAPFLYGEAETVQFTRSGAILGTPAYMAPEQLRGEPATARSDQFAFAVTLHEALFGRRPFEGRSVAALLEAQEKMRFAPQERRGVPRRVKSAITRALAPDPARRHASIDALLDELRPARPLRAWWVALSLLLVLPAGWWAVTRMARPRGCQPGAEILQPLWNPARRQALLDAAGGDPGAHATAEARARHLDWYAQRWIALHDNLCASRPEALGLGLECLSERARPLEKEAAPSPRPGEANLPSLDRCRNLATLPRAGRRDQVLASYRALDDVLQLGENPNAALAALDKVVAQARALDFPPLLAEALVAWGRARYQIDHDGHAVKPLVYEAARLAEQVGDDELRAEALLYLVHIAGASTGHEEAQTLATLGEAALARVDDEYLRSDLLWGLFADRYTAHRFDDALKVADQHLELARKLFGPQSLRASTSLDHRGAALSALGRYREAEADMRAALAIEERLLPPDSAKLDQTLTNLAMVLWHTGKLDEVVALSLRALAIDEKAYGADSTRLIHSIMHLAIAHSLTGHLDEAHADFLRARAIAERSLPADSADHAIIESNLADNEVNLGNLVAGEAAAQRALAMTERNGNDGFAIKVRFVLAEIRLRQKRFAEAMEMNERAQAAAEKLGPNHPDVAYAFLRRGQIFLAWGRAREALPALERSLEIMSHGQPEPIDLGDGKLELARALVANGGDRVRARRLAEEAAQVFAEGGVKQQDRPGQVARLLQRMR